MANICLFHNGSNVPPGGVQGVGDALRHAALARASAPSGAAGLAPQGGGFLRGEKRDVGGERIHES